MCSNKAEIAMLVAILLVVIAVYAVISGKMRTKDAEIVRLETMLSECRYSERDARLAIERQNASVEAVRVDTVVVERLVRAAEKKYAEAREIIVQSIERDSSRENKISNIDACLRRFHGVELRPANGD
jgi:hypothetical protein